MPARHQASTAWCETHTYHPGPRQIPDGHFPAPLATAAAPQRPACFNSTLRVVSHLPKAEAQGPCLRSSTTTIRSGQNHKRSRSPSPASIPNLIALAGNQPDEVSLHDVKSRFDALGSGIGHLPSRRTSRQSQTLARLDPCGEAHQRSCAVSNGGA